MTSRSEFLRGCDPAFENYGFDRAAFMALLNDSNTGSPMPTATQWERGLYLRQQFRLSEAACIIEGFHPSQWDAWALNEEPTKVISMLQAIMEASDELSIDTDGCGQVLNHHLVSHQSIAAWCLKNGLDWPLRQTPQVQPVTGAGAGAGAANTVNLSQRLAEAELKAEQLAQELATITAERDRLRHELQGLTEELVSTKKDAAQSRADLQQAKADLLQGKSRTSALKLVGGMALAVYKIPIKSGRLTGLADLRKDLDSVGVAISEDVIRSHLNAAAEVI